MGPNIGWSRKDLQLSLLQCIHQVGAHVTKHGEADNQWKQVNDLFFNLPANAELKEAHYNPSNARKLKDKWTDMYRNGMMQLKMMGAVDIDSSGDEVLKMIKLLHEEKEAAEFSKQRSFRKSSGGGMVAMPVTFSSSLPGNQMTTSAALPSVLFASSNTAASSSSSPESEDVRPLLLKKKRLNAAADQTSGEEAKKARSSNTSSATVAKATSSASTTIPSSSSSSMSEIPTLERNVREQMIALLQKENKKMKDILEEIGLKKDREKLQEQIEEIGWSSIILLYCSPGEKFSQTYFRTAIEQLGVAPLASLKLYGWLEALRVRAAPSSASSTSD